MIKMCSWNMKCSYHNQNQEGSEIYKTNGLAKKNIIECKRFEVPLLQLKKYKEKQNTKNKKLCKIVEEMEYPFKFPDRLPSIIYCFWYYS